MAMATAVANKDKSLMEHLAIAKSALATAEMHGQVLATTFPDTFLAGVMGSGNQTPDEMISELGKYQRGAIVSPQLQADVFSHFDDLAVCSDVANSIGQYVAITVAQEREEYRKKLLAIQHIHAVSVSAIDRMMETKQAIQEAEEAWSNIGRTSKLGRVLSAKERDEKKVTMEKAIKRVCDLHESEIMLKEAKEQMQSKQRRDLVAVGGNPMRLMVTAQDKYAMDVLKEQLREVDSSLRPNKDEREQCEKSRNLDIPTRLAADKGQQLVNTFTAFSKQFAHKLTIAQHYIERIGHDVHPDTGVFWGIDTGELPHMGNDFAGLSENCKGVYNRETLWFWSQLEVAFQAANQMDVLEECLTTFRFGLHGERKFKGFRGDGVLAYWCLLSRYRPTDERHRAMIEKKLNGSHIMFRNKSVSYDVAVNTITPIMTEARKISLKIKWMHTGSLWLKAMENDAKMTVALSKFKEGGPDQDDCILWLMDMAEEITANCSNPKSGGPEAMSAAMESIEWKEDDDCWKIWQEEDYNQAMWHANSAGVAGECWFGNDCRRTNCSFSHPKDDATGKGGGKGGKGKKGKGKGGPPKPCFKMGCVRMAFRHYDFCTECHKEAVTKGGCLCKNGKFQKLDGSITAAQATGYEAKAFWAAPLEHQQYQENVAAHAQHMLQQQQESAISDDDVQRSIDCLMAAYAGMPQHAANHANATTPGRTPAKRSQEAEATEPNKAPREGVSQLTDLLNAIDSRRKEHLNQQ